LNQVFRIAINHQQNVMPKWHHDDGWPRKVISSHLSITDLIKQVYALDYSRGTEAIKQLQEISSKVPNLTVQTVLAIQRGDYLCVTEWEPAPDGMIITFNPENENAIVPSNCHARRLEQ
tara:strand:+ start:492 stop:848 length:357 start_codon:yes stop_codon:yes gene_type:complete